MLTWRVFEVDRRSLVFDAHISGAPFTVCTGEIVRLGAPGGPAEGSPQRGGGSGWAVGFLGGLLAQDLAGDDDGAGGERGSTTWALKAVVAAVLLVFCFGDGRRLEAVGTEVRVHGGGDTVLAAGHFTVPAEVELCKGRLLGARARVEDSLLEVQGESHR